METIQIPKSQFQEYLDGDHSKSNGQRSLEAFASKVYTVQQGQHGGRPVPPTRYRYLQHTVELAADLLFIFDENDRKTT